MSAAAAAAIEAQNIKEQRRELQASYCAVAMVWLVRFGTYVDLFTDWSDAKRSLDHTFPIWKARAEKGYNPYRSSALQNHIKAYEGLTDGDEWPYPCDLLPSLRFELVKRPVLGSVSRQVKAARAE